MGRVIPDKVEDSADVDLKGVPPRIRILLVKTFDKKKKLHRQEDRKKVASELTRSKRGYSARIGDEYIQLPKAAKHAVHSAPYTFYITHVRREHEYICVRHSSSDYVPRLVQGIAGACHNCNRSTRTRVL